mmetsp:Transcript_28240/g.76490  ORF Transcript_28240/g.76490 Transcript_28240/m.76490 type:complete len:216 (+) Transcript_28240:403-1050(+)
MGAGKAHQVVAEGVLSAVLRGVQPEHPPLVGLRAVLQAAEHGQHRRDADPRAEEHHGRGLVHPDPLQTSNAEVAERRRKVHLVPQRHAVVQEGGDDPVLLLLHCDAEGPAARLARQAVVARLALFWLIGEGIGPHGDVLARIECADRPTIRRSKRERRDVRTLADLLLDREPPEPPPAARLGLHLLVELLLALDAVAGQRPVQLPPRIENLLPGV